MADPNVKVRISVEGSPEALAALRQLQQKSEEIGKKSARGIFSVNSALAGAGRILGPLGIAATAAAATTAVASFVRTSAAAVEEQGNLAAGLGTTVENFSVLVSLAQGANVPVELLTSSLSTFTDKLADLKAGAPDAERLFKGLGLAAEDFDGKDTAEAYALVAERLGKLETSYQKTDLAREFFGKGAVRMIPMMNDLAKKGFAQARIDAERFGTVLRDDVVQKVSALNKATGTMRTQLRNLVAEFIAGFGPRTTRGIQTLTETLLPQLQGVLGKVGGVFGVVFETMLNVLSAAGVVIRGEIAKWQNQLLTAQAVVEKLNQFKPDLGAAAKHIADAARNNAQIDRKTAEDLALIAARQVSAPPEAEPQPGAGDVPTRLDPKAIAALEQQRLAALKALADAETDLARAQLAFRREEEQRAFEAGLVSLEDHYRRRLTFLAQAFDDENALLERQRAEAEKIRDPRARATALRAIDLRQELLALKLVGDQAKVEQERRVALEQLRKQQLEFEGELMTTEARAHAEAMAHLEERVAAYRDFLVQIGTAAGEIDDLLDRFRRKIKLDVDFGDLKRRADAILQDLANERESIEIDVAAGRTTPTEGQVAIAAATGAAGKGLDKVIEDLKRLRTESNDPDFGRGVEAFINVLERAKLGIDGVTTATQSLVQSAGEAFEDALRGTLSAIGTEIQSIEDAALHLLDTFLTVMQQILAAELASEVAGFFGIVPKKASGGLITGPGGPREDRIPILASNFEHVQPAHVVRKPGMLRFLEDIRHGRIDVSPARLEAMRAGLQPIVIRGVEPRGYADGGLISTAIAGAASPATAAGGSGIALDINVTASPAWIQAEVVRQLESPTGQRAQLRNVVRNARATRRAMGG
jgi:hypothetical protein